MSWRRPRARRGGARPPRYREHQRHPAPRRPFSRRDRASLYAALSRLSELHVPTDDEIPPVDRLVAEHFRTHFEHCTEPSILRKGKPTSRQCKRLLGVLLEDVVGTPIALAELLARQRPAIRHATTPARTRDRTWRLPHAHLLKGPRPVLHARESDRTSAPVRAIGSRRTSNWGLPPALVYCALLSAYVRQEVTRRELDYLLPEVKSAGRGLARAPAGQTDEASEQIIIAVGRYTAPRRGPRAAPASDSTRCSTGCLPRLAHGICVGFLFPCPRSGISCSSEPR